MINPSYNFYKWKSKNKWPYCDHVNIINFIQMNWFQNMPSAQWLETLTTVFVPRKGGGNCGQNTSSHIDKYNQLKIFTVWHKHKIVSCPAKKVQRNIYLEHYYRVLVHRSMIKLLNKSNRTHFYKNKSLLNSRQTVLKICQNTSKIKRQPFPLSKPI